ncbi:MAG: 30S ribosomal protein S9 [bacterium]|nr:30S ribosomal protein S9 [bacterium]
MEKTKSKNEYIEAVGRRKTAVARVRLTPSAKTEVSVNGEHASGYFKTDTLRTVAEEALKASTLEQKWSVSAKITGGGANAQAEALRHGIARALVAFDHAERPKLKKLGYLKRDPRKKERKKFGLKKARKAPTWSKR